VARCRGQKSTSCGGDQRLKSVAYVSAAIEVSQPKFIAHFFCKALVTVQKNHRSKSMNFNQYGNTTISVILQK